MSDAFNACLTWLDTVKCTKPFTLSDAHRLYTMIRDMVPGARIDIYTSRGDQVHVRIELGSRTAYEDLDVV